MMRLFIYEKDENSDVFGNAADSLLRKCASLYLKEASLDSEHDTFREVLRTEKGKPYFRGNDIRFSVSHSGSLWVCLMGDSDCGIDVEKRRTVRNMNRFSERFFTAGERKRLEDAAKEEREKAFFDIWTEKEAFGKLRGIGISGGMLKLDTSDAEEKGIAVFRQIDIREGYVCTACTEKEEDIEVTILRL